MTQFGAKKILIVMRSLDENNHDLPQNQTDTRTNINEDVNDYHDAQHRGED